MVRPDKLASPIDVIYDVLKLESIGAFVSVSGLSWRDQLVEARTAVRPIRHITHAGSSRLIRISIHVQVKSSPTSQIVKATMWHLQRKCLAQIGPGTVSSRLF